ncbi:MAG: hypothetical protein P8Y05_06630 [Deinococcales bacterium]|jgi:hypothetical protein
MKESILRAAAIAALALALIMSVTTWVGVSTSSARGSFFMGFFEFALILFLGAVAWALFNALADTVANRGTLEMLTVRMAKIEAALERLAPEAAAEPHGEPGGGPRSEPRAEAHPATPPADEAEPAGEERR